SILCEDLILSVGNITDELKLVKQLLNRFEKWKSLFNKMGSDGLTPEEQRGLYGELTFLRKFLNHNNDFLKVLNTWVGTSNEIRDFQLNDWALEVKTTIGNNHQKIKVSSERQLDISHLGFLYLYHLSLEKAQESGESLLQIVFSIRQMLKIDFISLNKFNAKLFEAGFFEHHIELYKNTGYHLRNENFYLVNGNFPRIQENDLREGVGDVKYSIIVSNCQEFIQSEIQVLEKISS
ncbi:MAG: PD-(D/E)XK motif protein, partial [Bacteroidetes bacterium]|nr:PD-(D/E)XK motif protein [Bacteroidota bacterium]